MMGSCARSSSLTSAKWFLIHYVKLNFEQKHVKDSLCPTQTSCPWTKVWNGIPGFRGIWPKDSAGFDQNTMRDSSNNRIRDLTVTEEAWFAKILARMWYIGKENDIRDSDDITSGCEIFIKKEARMRDQESPFPDFRGLFILPGSWQAKIKNLFMLSVRISSYGCTREVWRARKMRQSCLVQL